MLNTDGSLGRSEAAVVSLLLIEDDASMARLLRHLLELDGYTRIRHVWTGEQAVAAAPEADIILLDHQLPDIRGIELLPRLLCRPDPPSIIMVTGHGSESLAAAALRQGAEDYLTKDHTLPELLPRILERVRRNRALRTMLEEAERDLVEALRSLEEHVLRHVCETRVTAIEAGTRAHGEGDSRQGTRMLAIGQAETPLLKPRLGNRRYPAACSVSG